MSVPWSKFQINKCEMREMLLKGKFSERLEGFSLNSFNESVVSFNLKLNVILGIVDRRII